MTEEEARQEGRREVAESIAEMFGICISHDEADRFIRALNKVIEAWDEDLDKEIEAWAEE